ncbi:MAG TPA: hypothetical protein VNO31_23340 [Umezawaea sp.]|nr:hypothetical protein [Umezawaea sp.]
MVAEAALAVVQAAEIADRPEWLGGDELPTELSFGVDRFLDGIEAWAASKT